MKPHTQTGTPPPAVDPFSTRSIDAHSQSTPHVDVELRGPAAPLPAQISRFEVRRQLGAGGYGVVYLAYDPLLQREIALKVSRHPLAWSGGGPETYLREARIAARLKHPHVVTIYEAGITPEHGVYIAMEFVEGETLFQRLQRGPLGIEQAASLCGQIAGAMHAGHQLGLVHRDLKPSNVLLDAAGNAKVCDFGLALEENVQAQARGTTSGTWRYMSPEQVRGEAHLLDGRSDLWSLGIILYECLVARHPFHGESLEEIRDEILNRDPKPVRQINDAIPAGLDELCRKCLQRELPNRIRSGADFRRDLQRAVQPATRKLGLGAWVGLALCGVLLAGLFAALWWNRGQPSLPPRPGPAVAKEGQGQKPPGLQQPGAGEKGLVTVKSLVGSQHASYYQGQLISGGGGLKAATSTLELLSFGTLGENDRLEISLEQLRWTGGIGLFFAHRQIGTAGNEGAAFQAVVVEQARPTGSKALWFHYDYPDNDRRFWRGEILSSLPLGELANQPLHLSLQLNQGTIAELRIGDRPFPPPSLAARRLVRSATSGPGEFGLLLNHSGGSVKALSINGGRRLFTLPARGEESSGRP